eukprot:COSAG02_NODE_3428_length_6761_cov_2.354398_6_plen_48_part_01
MFEVADRSCGCWAASESSDFCLSGAKRREGRIYSGGAQARTATGADQG